MPRGETSEPELSVLWIDEEVAQSARELIFAVVWAFF